MVRREIDAQVLHIVFAEDLSSCHAVNGVIWPLVTG
jgi:hypothetical protein